MRLDMENNTLRFVDVRAIYFFQQQQQQTCTYISREPRARFVFMYIRSFMIKQYIIDVVYLLDVIDPGQ